MLFEPMSFSTRQKRELGIVMELSHHRKALAGMVAGVSRTFESMPLTAKYYDEGRLSETTPDT